MERILQRFTVLIICGILVFCSSNINFGGNRWRGIIGSDGKGYYAYLPALFIYHDLNLGFFDSIEKKYSSKETFYDYRTGDAAGRVFDKYYCGTAVLMMPFFLTAHGLTKLAGLPADGYSRLYAVFVNIAALFYGTLGLYFLQRLLESYSTKRLHIALVLAAFCFGTSLFYYMVCEPSMSHSYSFFCITALLLMFRKMGMNAEPRLLPVAGILLGLTVLIRPVNGLVLFSFPFFFSDRKSLGLFIRERAIRWKDMVLPATLVMLICSVQLMLYHTETGNYFVDSYKDEHFNWLHPRMLKLLFSYKKGLFVYTPVVLLSFSGLFILYSQNNYQFWVFILFFLLITYVFSSWWCWYYGGSFGLRAYVEYYALFAVLMVIALDGIGNNALKALFVSAVIAALFLTVFQTYQYRYYLIHWSDMTGEKYWKVFLRFP